MIPVRYINLIPLLLISTSVQAMPRVMNPRTAAHEVFDQRQKGDENWMVHIKNVYVTVPDLSKLFGSIDQMHYGDVSSFENCKEPYCLDVTDFVLNPNPNPNPKPLDTEAGSSTTSTDDEINEEPENLTSDPKPEPKPENKPMEKHDTNEVVNINFINENPKRIPYFGHIPAKPASAMLDENFNLIRKKPQVEIISTPEPAVTPTTEENLPALVEINTKKPDSIIEIGTKKVIQADREIIIEIGNKRTTEIHPEVTEPSVVKVPEHHLPLATTTQNLVEEPQILVEITEESKIGTTVPPIVNAAAIVNSRKNNKVQVIVEPDLSRVPIPAEEAVTIIESPAHEIKLVDISDAVVALKDDIEAKSLGQNEFQLVPVQVMMD